MEPGLPLYDIESPPDAWHRVAAPGGYERWHFDAESADQSVRVVVTFWKGDILNGQYARRYRAYLRHPTRRRPPLPGEYAAVRVAVYEGERLAAGFRASGEFAGSKEITGLRIGRFQVHRDDAGDLRIVGRYGRNFSAYLIFRPVLPHRPHQAGCTKKGVRSASSIRTPDPLPPHLVGWALPTSLAYSSANGGQCPPYTERPTDPEHHHWVIADPLCVVEGDIDIGNRVIKFAGRGYHDHHFGDRPLWSLRRWMRGRVLEGDWALMFQVAETGGATDSLAQVFEADAGGLHVGEAEMFSVGGARWTLTGLGYPGFIRVGGWVFDTPKILDRSPTRLLIAYRNRQSSDSPLLCEIVYPRRVGWPF